MTELAEPPYHGAPTPRREVGRSWGQHQMHAHQMSCSALRRAASSLPLDARRALAEGIAADLRIVDTVTTGAEWMSFRLRAALSKRAAKAERAAALDGTEGT